MESVCGPYRELFYSILDEIEAAEEELEDEMVEVLKLLVEEIVGGLELLSEEIEGNKEILREEIEKQVNAIKEDPNWYEGSFADFCEDLEEESFTVEEGESLLEAYERWLIT